MFFGLGAAKQDPPTYYKRNLSLNALATALSNAVSSCLGNRLIGMSSVKLYSSQHTGLDGNVSAIVAGQFSSTQNDKRLRFLQTIREIYPDHGKTVLEEKSERSRYLY